MHPCQGVVPETLNTLTFVGVATNFGVFKVCPLPMVRGETLKTLEFVSVGTIFKVFKVAPLA